MIDDCEWAWCSEDDECKCGGWWDPGGPKWGAPWVEVDASSDEDPGGGGNCDPNWAVWWANNDEGEEEVIAEVVDENGEVIEMVDGPVRRLLVVGGDVEGVDDDAVGHWNWLFAPDINMSRINVSIGVLPTRRTKNSCSITVDETVRSDGRRNKSFPKRVGWFGYWVRQYSSRAHWDFSWSWSIVWDSESPHASEKKINICYFHRLHMGWYGYYYDLSNILSTKIF